MRTPVRTARGAGTRRLARLLRDPRETTLAELADEIGVPQSTLQYRLQRAESWLASGFVNECL
ncbi:helix-turn-helix domain-containing protein [Haladaptatus sp. GCM10025893]|uniref:helix-turn-helix domain-containing protein n=1 Tax=Haladaptatus sp. GCM10025893 TaxID=3252659 RepID=UPI0036072CBE